MRIVSVAVILVGIFAGGVVSLRAGQSTEQRSVAAAGQTQAAGSSEASRVVGVYCAGCHNGVTRSPSGALLDQFDTARFGVDQDIWARAYRQVQAGTMPPVGALRPDRQSSDALLASIETGLGAKTPPPADATSQEIADHLALLLWNGAPDASLLEDVRRNQLTNPVTLEHQITRMLDDDRARAFVSRFFFPWLGLDQLGKAEPDKAYFPDFDIALRDAMATETELFILSQLRSDRDPIELWNANYTFLNEPLARHYGVPGIAGAQFRRVVLDMPERAGLLGQGSVFMATSRYQQGKETFTSPAARAIWVRLHFLGAAPPHPAPNAQPVKAGLPITPQTRTLPAEPCVNCHRNFFPLGYALENFDPVGHWRTRDQVGPVDASSAFVDGTPMNGIVGLRDALLRRPDAFRTAMTEKLLVYAAGKPLNTSRMEPGTLIRARQILGSVTAARWSSIIAAVVRAKAEPAN